jgi:hypothetical protein
LATSNADPPLKEKFDCVRRELALRHAVYPRLIASGRLKREKAKRELELMEAIVVDYERFLEAQRGAIPDEG